MIKIEEIQLGLLVSQIEKEILDAATPLDMYDYRDNMVIVERTRDVDHCRVTGYRYDMLDGYHRIAGLYAGGLSHDSKVPAIVLVDEPTLAAYVADKFREEVHTAAVLLVQTEAGRV